MLYKYHFLFLTVFYSIFSFSSVNDSINVFGNFVNKNEFLTGKLCQFGSDNKVLVIFPIKEDRFSFSLPPSTDPGVYRLYFISGTKNLFFDIIIDGYEKNISFDISFNGFNVFPTFHSSIENQDWYGYIEKSKKITGRLDILFNYLSNFHEVKNETDEVISRIYQKERKLYYKLFDAFVSTNEKRWCGLLVKNRPFYYSDVDKPTERDYIRRNFFWEGIDTNNLKLLNTPLYKELIHLYFDKYYLNSVETYTPTLKEYQLKKGIDDVVNRFSTIRETKIFIKDFLINYFKDLERLDLIEYLDFNGNK